MMGNERPDPSAGRRTDLPVSIAQQPSIVASIAHCWEHCANRAPSPEPSAGVVGAPVLPFSRAQRNQVLKVKREWATPVPVRFEGAV
eukprot:scaffold294447_cov36-Tisochrysis_lutea.AAC.1